MLPDKDQIRMKHMLDAAEKLVLFTKDSKREDLDKDEKLGLAVVRLTEILGEAASKITDETREEHSDFPWREMTSTRNRLIHGYFDVDYDIIWAIIKNDIPGVIEKIKVLLPGGK